MHTHAGVNELWLRVFPRTLFMHVSGHKTAQHLQMVLESVGYNLSNPDTCQSGPALPEGHLMRGTASPAEQHLLDELRNGYPRCGMLLYCDGDGVLHSERLDEHLQISSTWSHRGSLVGSAPTASDGRAGSSLRLGRAAPMLPEEGFGGDDMSGRLGNNTRSVGHTIAHGHAHPGLASWYEALLQRRDIEEKFRMDRGLTLLLAVRAVC